MTELTAAKLASTSKVEMTQLVLPGYANSFGNAFGGRVMQWTDLAAAMAAAPIRVGQIAILRAQVNAVFGSSLEVEVTVDSEDPRTGARSRCCDAFLTFVALGPDGKPARAPLLLPQTEDEERRAREAAARRAARLSSRPGS